MKNINTEVKQRNPAPVQVVGIRENKQYLDQAIDYFSSKWNVDKKIYADSMSSSIETESPLPRWYLLLKGQTIAGSYGLITNDFISRQDLCPWLCALYVEEKDRGLSFGSMLLEHCRAEAGKAGFNKVYLSTDLNGYYEKYGWKYIATGYHPWGDESKIYEAPAILNSAGGLMPGLPVLETKRLILRKIELNDAEDVYRYAKEPLVAKHLTWEAHRSVEDSIRYIRAAAEKIDQEKAGDWGIQLKETGKIIGSIGYVEVNRKNSSAVIGYALSRDYWGQGIMTEALQRVLRHGLEEMRLIRIEGMHDIENEASGQVMQKAGMQYEGTMPKKMLIKGRFRDVKQYSVVVK